MTRELWVMEVERDEAGRIVGQPTALGKATGEVVDDVLALLLMTRTEPVTLARDDREPEEAKP